MSYSQSFVLTPGTLSGFYVKAMREAGYAAPKAWRASRGNGVDVLTIDNKVVHIDMAPGNQIVVQLVEEAVTST